MSERTAIQEFDADTRALLNGRAFAAGNHGEPGQLVVEKAIKER
jgi:ferredoxin/flavodoxin---NADP+ reductase